MEFGFSAMGSPRDFAAWLICHFDWIRGPDELPCASEFIFGALWIAHEDAVVSMEKRMCPWAKMGKDSQSIPSAHGVWIRCPAWPGTCHAIPRIPPGMANLGFNTSTDLGDRLATWARQFSEETTYRRYERACAFVMDETAKRLANRMNEAMDDVIDRPTPWMRKAWQYRRGLARGRQVGEVSAETFVKDDQSIVIKFLVGEGPNVRRPGDVGLAKDRILLPNWKNLEATQGIRPNRNGNLPGGVAARLNREAGGTVARRRVAGRWGVYKGEIDVGGSRLMGYMRGRPGKSAPSARTGA